MTRRPKTSSSATRRYLLGSTLWYSLKMAIIRSANSSPRAPGHLNQNRCADFWGVRDPNHNSPRIGFPIRGELLVEPNGIEPSTSLMPFALWCLIAVDRGRSCSFENRCCGARYGVLGRPRSTRVDDGRWRAIRREGSTAGSIEGSTAATISSSISSRRSSGLPRWTRSRSKVSSAALSSATRPRAGPRSHGCTAQTV